MAITPSAKPGVTLSGALVFSVAPANLPAITDSYSLTIEVPHAFPAALPAVTEIGGRIPRDGHHHVNPDETLCLGSPLRLLLKLSKQPTLSGFTDGCIVPYLYAVTHKLRFGGGFVFDELDHGARGVLRDYMVLFGLEKPQQARAAWLLLGMKERHANKRPCPCGCGKRLGRCKFNRRLQRFRALASRTWFRAHAL